MIAAGVGSLVAVAFVVLSVFTYLRFARVFSPQNFQSFGRKVHRMTPSPDTPSLVERAGWPLLFVMAAGLGVVDDEPDSNDNDE